MKIRFLVLLFNITASFLILGCSSGNVINEKKELGNFSGNWEKIKPETELGGYKIKLKFDGDKFYYRVLTYVDYIDGKNPCVKTIAGWNMLMVIITLIMRNSI